MTRAELMHRSVFHIAHLGNHMSHPLGTHGGCNAKHIPGLALPILKTAP